MTIADIIKEMIRRQKKELTGKLIVVEWLIKLRIAKGISLFLLDLQEAVSHCIEGKVDRSIFSI